jgi:hypothetical protein
LESDKRSQERLVLERVAQKWGSDVLHIWDRGFAGSPWITYVLKYPIRFLLRWKKDYKLIGPDGQEKKAWQITRGKRSWDHRLVYDARRRCFRKTGIIAAPVRLPDHPARLWLVVSRPGHGQKPWYLLTTQWIGSSEDAWRVVFAYARRWQVEMSIRFTKSEMAFECPRLHQWEARLKFLWIAALAFAFLLSLLLFPEALVRLFCFLCHRTGKWSREPSAPLYRLRLSISRLWRFSRPRSLPKLI